MRKSAMDRKCQRAAQPWLVTTGFLLNLVLCLAIGKTAPTFFRAGLLDHCCLAGMQWANASMGRCAGYPGPVVGVEPEGQGPCLSVLEVCCLKQVGLDMCEAGKQIALDRLLCAARDFDPGSEQFRECCQCCQLGVAARTQGASCDPPGLGSPCDAKFVECCTDRPSANYTIAVLQPGSRNTTSTTRDSDNAADQPANHANSKFSNGNSNNNNSNREISSSGSSKGDNAGDNVDECALFPGAVCSHICVDLPRGFECACPTGYQMSDDKRTCRFLDASEVLDCSTNNRCEHRCVSRNLVSECQCYEGYRLNTDGLTCSDVNECAEGSFRCSPEQMCLNTKGGYSCLSADCPPGSTRNPRTGQCESDSACLTGFVFNSITRKCEDINECALGTDDCGVGMRCENTNGAFACRRVYHCGTGYTLDEDTQQCVDNDECQLGTHNCANGFVCQNMQGSFRCVPRECPTGYRFNPGKGDCEAIICRRGLRPNRVGVCEDINECEENTHRCQQYQTCLNTVGGYRCRSLVNCPPGFEPTSNSGCQDVNECQTGAHRCGPDQECVNRQGSYFCQCPRGYRHDPSGRCLDVNECAYGATICPITSKCVNTQGSYKCECTDGYISDESGGCLDIDECLVDNVCQHECRNSPGSYFCVCKRGYQLREDKRSCEDVDECTQFRGIGGRGGVCGGRCINTPGSYRCECPEGWRLKRDGRSCEDIDECTDNPSYCQATQPDSICVNTRGSFKCPVVHCPEGFVKTTASGKTQRATWAQTATAAADGTGALCARMECAAGDNSCAHNKTKTVAWQFLPLPAMDFLAAPLKLLHIKTVGYSRFPNLRLLILAGNEDGLFEAAVTGDEASLYLLKPVAGPADLTVTLCLENRDFTGRVLVTRHVTYVLIYVSEFDL